MRVLTDVMLFESLPQTFVGLRNGVSLALIIVIVAEMFIGSVDGLGHNVLDNQMLFEMPRMYAAIFVAGALRVQPDVPSDRAALRPLVGTLRARASIRGFAATQDEGAAWVPKNPPSPE